MRTSSRFFAACLGLFLSLLSLTAARGASEQVVATAFGSSGSAPDYINLFELFNNGLYWTEGSGGCSTEFRSESKIGILGTIAGTPKRILSDCTLTLDGTTRDDAYAFFTHSGRLWRKAINSLPADPSQEIPAAPFTPIGNTMQMGAMATFGGRVYWTDTTGTYFDILSMKEDGTDYNYELLGTGSKIVKLQVSYYSTSVILSDAHLAFFILTDGGVLMRYDIDPRATTITTLATGVTDFVLRDESSSSGLFFTRSTAVYAVTGLRFQIQPATPAGRVVRINASSGSQRVIHTASGQAQITSITADVNGLYIVEQPVVGCGDLFGCLLSGSNMKRQTNPAHNGNSANPFDLIDVSDGTFFNLRSDTQWLYFIAGTQIRRIRTDSPALQIDVQADNLEVVQAIQNLNNDVRLIANKPTFVRGYAHLTLNTTGKSPWFPGAQLHGFFNGSELPDSPISPVNLTPVTTESDLAAKRPDLQKSFLFELPNSWVQAGNLRLTMTVDESHTLPETVANPFLNNSVSTPTLTLIRKGSPCLVFVPLWNSSGEYNPLAPNSGFPDIIERAKSLMPVEDFHVFFSAARIEKPVVKVEFHPECFIPLTFCLPVQVHISNHPFSMPTDKNWALFWTAVFNALNKNPAGCADTHWIGTLPSDGQGGFNGIGGARGLKVGDLVDLGILNGIPIPATPLDSTLVVRMDRGQGSSSVAWDSINGGHTLAHELGHNYGRFHIDQSLSSSSCGSQKPDRPWQLDPPYPFDPCTLGPVNYADPAAFFGFDPITRSVVAPDMAGDTMSYASSHWSSRVYWDALIGAVANPPPPTPMPASSRSFTEIALQGVGDSYMLLGGEFDFSSNSVQLLPAHVLPESAFDASFLASSLTALRQLPAALPYRVKLLSGLGQLLSDQPLRFLTGVDEPGSSSAFMQIMAFPPQTERVQVWGNGQMLSEQVVSLHKPVLQLATPVYLKDTHQVQLSLSASDADGDALLFTVLYSEDHGITWRVIDPAHVSEQISIDGDLLPGGSQAQLRVIATDGLNSSSADSVPFSVPAHAPKVMISGILPDQRVPYGEPLSLFGLGYQPEYGTVEGASLSWTLSGPQTLGQPTSGSHLKLSNLAPGHYSVSLIAKGPDGRKGTNSLAFDIGPLWVADAEAPNLDGFGNDPGYTQASLVPLDLGLVNASIRLIHKDGFLYVSAQDLPYAGNSKASFGLRIDTLADQASTAKQDDAGFFVDEDGITSQEVARGGVMVTTLQPRVGYSAVVARGQKAWSAELRIEDTLLGGWNHRVGLMLAASAPPSVYRWPSVANRNAPSTWAPADFGTVTPPPNRAPVALAGPNQTLTPAVEMPVTLDGTGSYDADGNGLTYLWSQISGPARTLTGASTAKTSFLAEPVTAPVTLRFRLVVQDGKLNSAPSDAEVRLLPAVLPSTAQTGPRQQIKPDGSFSGELAAFGFPGMRFQILATSNFVNWVSIGTNSLNYFAQIPFIDSQAGQYPRRFYRATELVKSATQSYFNDFEGAVGNEWSLKTVDITPTGGRKFLGQFANGGPHLQLNSLPLHNRARLEFDLYLIRTWDGNDLVYGTDRFKVGVTGGLTLLDTSFSCSISTALQSYPYGSSPGSPPLTGSQEHGTLGFVFGNYGAIDAVYHFSLRFNHSANSLGIDFTGIGLQELADESWGLDNVKVIVEEDP